MKFKKGQLVRFVGRPVTPNCYGWIGTIVGPTERFHERAEYEVTPPIHVFSDLHKFEWVYESSLAPINGESPEQSLEAMRELMQTKKEKVTT